MTVISEFLKSYKSRMLIQIHDELIIEIPTEEEKIIPQILELMQTNSLGLSMRIDAKKCIGSWANKEKDKYVLPSVGEKN